jgi:hypothetical protein
MAENEQKTARVAVPTMSTPEQIAERFDRHEAELNRRREELRKKSPQFHYVPGNEQ